MHHPDFRLALMTIQTEYLEMPELTLTLTQAARLWTLPVELCRVAVGALVTTGFLVETADGSFRRRGTPAVHVEYVDPLTWAVGRISESAPFPD